METLTIKYWQKLFFGLGKDEKTPASKIFTGKKDIKKLNGKIINYRGNRKPELL
jgi:hypothetical protein